jgi:pantetheine-phosphate adenylyltransferase
MGKRIAVYAGSFDPPTLGHIDVAKRAALHFDEIHLLVATNKKKKSLFSPKERVALLSEALNENDSQGNFVVNDFEGLLTTYCKQVGAKILIRGLRAVSDFEGELAMATMNRKLYSEVDTFLIMTDDRYFFLSSSLVKELATHKASLKNIVPRCVEKALASRPPND